jgi:hypothetical protein
LRKGGVGMPFPPDSDIIILPSGGKIDTGPVIIIDGTTGKITAKAANGSEITIDPANLNPQINFISPDGTNSSFINSVSDQGANTSDLGLNSGGYTPGDGVGRRVRIFMRDSFDAGHFQVIKAATQSVYGGYVLVRSFNYECGYKDQDNGISYNLNFDHSGYANFVVPDVRYNGKSQPMGLQSYIPATIGSIAFGTSETNVIHYDTPFTFLAGRIYEMRMHLNVSSTSGQVFLPRIRKGNSGVAGQVISSAGNQISSSSAQYTLVFRVANYGTTDVTTNYSLTMVGSAAGNSIQNATDSGTTRMEIVDIGASIDYSFEPAIT